MADNVVTVFGDTTLGFNDRVALVASQVADTYVYLPASHATGQRHGIKDYGADGSGNGDVSNIYVHPNGNTIDGDPNPRLLGPGPGDYLNVVSNGSDWGIIP